MKEEKFVRFNKSLGKHSRVFFLDPAHIMPLTISVTFGIVVGQIWSLNFFWTVLMMAFPFTTWLVVVGDKTWKFLAKLERVPRWTRGRVIADNPVHKRRVGRIVK